MAGPNVEVFKFGLYMFFPVWIMFKFGDPQWYQDYVLPRPPRTISDIDAELARYKAERAAKRARQQLSGADDASAAISPADTTQSEIAATARAFYGRRAAGETEAASLVAGNDGERMV